MSSSLRKKKEGRFCTVNFVRGNFILTFVFYLNIYYIECTFRIYTLLHIKKYYCIHFFASFQNCRKPSVYAQSENGFVI